LGGGRAGQGASLYRSVSASSSGTARHCRMGAWHALGQGGGRLGGCGFRTWAGSDERLSAALSRKAVQGMRESGGAGGSGLWLWAASWLRVSQI
jgi:hypothetical protein